jgi:8-oxo-dGTP pyrophosphatase MutT (NUDIX family)
MDSAVSQVPTVTDAVVAPSLLSLDKLVLRRLIADRLRDTQAPDAGTPFQIAGLSRDQYHLVEHLFPAQRIEAAVLIPIVDRPEGLSLLFTQRATHLRKHAGQISFPGGRIEAHDAGPVATALRETEEEIGLARELIEVAGYLPPQLIFSGFSVVPVIAFVQPSFELRLDPGEVDEAFEVPLAFFLDPVNHRVRERAFGDVTTLVYDLPYGERRIWGATAGMLMSFYHLLAHG